MDTRELGNLGEELACEYLVKNGFKIVCRNYRISFGEIDIIAKKHWKLFRNDKTIHFVEVKTIIAQDGFYPEDRVDFKKQRKLRQLSEIWLKNNKFKQNYPCQIDVIGVTISNGSKEPKIDYFENVVSDNY